MGDREDLAALRRLAELEAKSGGISAPKGPKNYKALSRPEIVDPTADMGTGERFLAGVGKTFTDIGQGVAQRFGGVSTQDVEAKRDADVALMATPAGFLGALGGGVAASAPMAPLAASLPGAIGVGAAYGGAQPTGAGESALANAALGGATAGAMKYGIDKAVPVLSAALQKGQSAIAPANARAQELAKALREGQALGLKVSPTQANPSAVNRVLESIGGKHATQQQLSAANQNAVYGASQRHAGLQPNQALTKEALADARKVAAEPYRQVAAMSPEAEALLKEWRQMNQRTSMHWDEYARSKSVDAFDKYEASKRAAAQALEGIEQIAQSNPQTAALTEALRGARVQIAKIHTVEKAMKGSSVDPRSYARAAQRGEPVSGELGTMARFAQDFPQAMQAPQVGGSVGVNQLLPWLGGGIGGAGGGPIGAGAGAALGAVAPPLARALLLSRPYQATMTMPPTQAPSAALSLSKALLSNKNVHGMLPGMAGMYAGSQ